MAKVAAKGEAFRTLWAHLEEGLTLVRRAYETGGLNDQTAFVYVQLSFVRWVGFCGRRENTGNVRNIIFAILNYFELLKCSKRCKKKKSEYSKVFTKKLLIYNKMKKHNYWNFQWLQLFFTCSPSRQILLEGIVFTFVHFCVVLLQNLH